MRYTFFLLMSLLLAAYPVGIQNGGVGDTGQIEEDFSGTWAQLQVTSEISKIPFIGEVTGENSTLLRLIQVQDGSSLTVTAEVCSIENNSGTPLVKIVFPEAFVESLEVAVKPSVIESSDEGYRFFQPRFTQLRGVRLESPETDPLPTEASDPRVFDQDEDSKPGLTVRITLFGFISGEVYVIQRDRSILNGRVTSPSTIDGLIEWGVEQVVLGASSSFLKAGTDSHPDPVAENSYFRTTRIDLEMDCAAIIENQETLFAR